MLFRDELIIKNLMKTGKIEGTDNVFRKKNIRHGKFYLFGQLSTADGKIFGEINTKFGKARVCSSTCQ